MLSECCVPTGVWVNSGHCGQGRCGRDFLESGMLQGPLKVGLLLSIEVYTVKCTDLSVQSMNFDPCNCHQDQDIRPYH